MVSPDSTTNRKSNPPPLTIPNDIWKQVSSDEKAVLRRAQKIVDHLLVREMQSLATLREGTGFAVEELLASLHALSGMRLVEVENDGREVLVKLIAVPDEHVRVVGP